LCSPEEFHGEGPSKHQKNAESPLTGEALVLDTLVGLIDKVLQLWKEVGWHGELIFSSLVDVKKGSMEEVRDQKWELENK